MSRAPLHPLSLHFRSDLLEAAFRADHARRAHGLVRLSLVLGLLQYAGYGFLDPWMVPVAVGEVRLIRLAVCLYVGLGIAYTFTASYRRHVQAALASIPVVCGLGVAGMAWLVRSDPATYHYYAAIVLILLYTHVLLRLRFVVASLTGAGLVAVYLAVVAVAGMPGPILANNAFFLLSASASGMVASYALEHYARRVFWHTRQQARTNAELAGALDGLRRAQAGLIQQEKLAGLGRLTAGVAHELKNPLNFVTNFARLSEELTDELGAALAAGVPHDEVAPLLADLRQNVERIREHGARADAIVRGMLEHAAGRPGAPRTADLNRLVEAQAALAVEAFRQRHGGFAPAFTFDPEPGLTAAAPEDVGRVVLALVDNALHAVLDRARTTAGGDGAAYVPGVTVRTRRDGAAVRIEVEDNGAGIAEAVRERVFEPFFTTRAPGQGTGLALSTAHELVTRGHGGRLDFHTEEGAGTTFVVTLPA